MPEIVTWSEAREKGLKNYFSGIPCKRGHVAERTFSSGMCKECASQSNKLWMKENEQRRKAAEKKYKAENIDHIREKKRAYRHANPEKTREGNRRRALRIIDHIRARAIQWQKDNPDKVRAREGRRRARKNAAGGKFTASDLKSLFDMQSGKCAYCFVKLGKNYHADHIVPIAKGGTSWPDNIQLCCPTCNISKGAKDPFDFARYIGRLI